MESVLEKRENAIFALTNAKAKLDVATTRDEALAILKEAGKAAAYSPAFRCLIMGMSPEDSIRWGR